MKKEESGRQLKLSEQDQDERVVEKKGKKKRNKVKDRWVVFMVLLITVLVSLSFYFVSGVPKKEKVVKPEKDWDFFGSAVYEF